MGSINVVKTSAQSLGPLVTGVLAEKGFFGLSFCLAGSLKMVYDLAILGSFLGLRGDKDSKRDLGRGQEGDEERDGEGDGEGR